MCTAITLTTVKNLNWDPSIITSRNTLDESQWPMWYPVTAGLLRPAVKETHCIPQRPHL